jgi:hypothetical protein
MEIINHTIKKEATIAVELNEHKSIHDLTNAVNNQAVKIFNLLILFLLFIGVNAGLAIAICRANQSNYWGFVLVAGFYSLLICIDKLLLNNRLHKYIKTGLIRNLKK